jgi:hypothetical protein
MQLQPGAYLKVQPCRVFNLFLTQSIEFKKNMDMEDQLQQQKEN